VSDDPECYCGHLLSQHRYALGPGGGQCTVREEDEHGSHCGCRDFLENGT